MRAIFRFIMILRNFTELKIKRIKLYHMLTTYNNTTENNAFCIQNMLNVNALNDCLSIRTTPLEAYVHFCKALTFFLTFQTFELLCSLFTVLDIRNI